MAKKKFETTIDVNPPVEVAQIREEQLLKTVRVINSGKPFLCDLTSYGYGMRWPTNAIYFIPTHKFMELLEHGFEGRNI